MTADKTGHYLAKLSHEIRTPITIMMGMCDVARNHADDQERVIQCLDKITNSGEYLIHLINNILEMSKMEEGCPVIVKEAFSLEALLDELYECLEPIAVGKGIRLLVSVTGENDKMVVGDYSRVMQILTNLVTNAIKYTPSGGVVSLRAEEVYGICGCMEQESVQEEAFYRFVCQDNGIGMSPAFLLNIFEPFTREQDEALLQADGTGLGMAIVKETVNALGGTIHICSEKGTGTVVTVKLGLRQE